MSDTATGVTQTATQTATQAAASASDLTGWSVTAAGWSPWWVVPLALVAAWAIRRLYRREVAALPQRTARWLLLLRGAAVLLLVLLLIEPAITRFGERVEEPLVTVLVDASQSMVVDDAGVPAHRRLDEAIALGLVDGARRDQQARAAGEHVAGILADLPRIRSALRADEASDDLAADIAQLSAQLSAARAALGGHPQAERRLGTLLGLLAEAEGALSGSAEIDAADLAERLAQWRVEGQVLVRSLAQAQHAADASLVNSLDEDDPLRRGLQQVAELSRFERAAQLVTKRIQPRLAERAEIEVRRLDSELARLDPTAVGQEDLAGLTGSTNLDDPLRALADETGGRNLRGVLVVGDGRITAGGDPRATAGVLRARGARVGGVVVGHAESLRDAVVAGISGPREVFAGESIRLDVRFRISGYGESTWELVLSRDGEELTRRAVSGIGSGTDSAGGSWQVERFECPADQPGVATIEAALQPLGPVARLAESQHGITWQQWTGIAGDDVEGLTDHPSFPDEPVEERRLGAARAPTDIGDDYGSRMSGWIVPPRSGDYRFHIAGDDEVQLWLSTDSRREHTRLVARVPDYTGPDEWDKAPTQGSDVVSLRAQVPYYVEVLHKEGSGDDHYTLAWTPPGGERTVISGEHLLPADAPIDQLFAEGDTASGNANDQQALPDEATRENNSAEIAVVVNEDPLRVLVLDALPRWDSRYLVSLFQRDRRVEVVHRYRHVHLDVADEPFLPPDQETLDRFDMVVLGDLQPDELLPADQERLAAFVRRRGGFLVLLAGPRGMPAGYSLGPLADLLPVHPVPDAGRSPSRDQRAVVQLTDDGQQHAITAVLDDPALNRRLWPALPPLRWTATGFAAKAGATVLLETVDHATPVVALQRYGAGRVCYLGSDESWRWRDRLGDRVHQAFWLQVQRWGLGKRLRGSDRRLQVSLDRTRMTPDGSAELRARVVDADGAAIDAAPTAVLHRLDADGAVIPASRRDVELAALSDADGLWRQSLSDLPTGRWQVRVTVDHPQLADLAEERILTVRRRESDETLILDADPAAMADLANAGGLQSGGMADVDRVLDALLADLHPKRHALRETTHLWNTYWALLLIVGLLLAEWIIRKRQGLP